MTSFPEPPSDTYGIVYLENTDRELPIKLDQNMRYAYFKTIARGGKAIVMSCKDLHLSRTVCYKKLRPEIAHDPIEQQRFLALCYNIQIRFLCMNSGEMQRRSTISL